MTRPRDFVLIGVGGLGGPVAYALAAAGAGRLHLVDPDVVELSNLQRQIQFGMADLGRPKVLALRDELARRGFGPERVVTRAQRFAPDQLDAADRPIVVEGSDDLATKFAVNDAGAARGLAVAIGGVDRRRGQVFVAGPGRACYRCLFEEPPGGEAGPTCADAGVLGAVVAVIGGHLATAALALAAGERPPSLQVWDDVARSGTPRAVELAPRPTCPACGESRALPLRTPGP